ncbi:hypothetical protein [Thermicanus aegyptius]|uniref:hypothetical protein n=1 Tax=Thermicanus aegyptius TaxID=94009 RepID=UPI00041E9C44|nr:hypothetical protein [Thermicanus aegyptius]
MRKHLALLGSFLFLLLLSGCFYPGKEEENFSTLTFQVQTVQSAVDRYFKQTGSLPLIENSGERFLYEKNAIDFGKLYPQYLSTLPTNSFEKGGHYRYVLYLNGEEIAVKLIDLTLSSAVGELQLKINDFFQREGILPMKRGPNLYQYEIDYEKLGIKKPVLNSPFTGKPLSFALSPKGEVFIDYAPDLMQYKEKGYTGKGEDAREILIENSYFVPVKSFPYRWIKGEPVLSMDLPR